MRCRRSDSTFYGTGGTCRKGVQDESELVKELSARFPTLAGDLTKLSKRINSLPDKEKSIFKEAISTQMDVDSLRKNWENEQGGKKQKGESGRLYREDEKENALKKQINGWNKLLDAGYPKTLVLRNGEQAVAPDGMQPVVTPSSGQPGYILPLTNGKSDGRKFNPKSKGVYTQNRAGKEDTDRVLGKMSEFRKSQRDAGLQWPTQKLPPRTDIELNPQKIVASLSGTEKILVATNGLPKDGDEGMPGARLYRWYNKPENKHLLDERVRDVVDRYVEQGGRSGITGKPINLPGLKARAEYNEEKATVDHFNPISGGKKMDEPTIRKIFDHKGNFLLAEEGPNQARQESDWDAWLDKRLKSGGSGKFTLERQTNRITIPTPRKRATANDLAKKTQLALKIEKFAKRLGASPAAIRSDEDLLKMALGSHGITQWKKFTSGEE